MARGDGVGHRSLLLRGMFSRPVIAGWLFLPRAFPGPGFSADDFTLQLSTRGSEWLSAGPPGAGS